MSETIRVCHVVSSFRPIIGGAERATENLCKGLVNRGIDVIVLTRHHLGLDRCEEVTGIPVYRLGYPSRTKLGTLSFALHALWLLATRFRDYRIIHVQNIDAPLLVGFFCKALFGRHLIATIQGETPVLAKRQSTLGRMRLNLARLLVDRYGSPSREFQRQIEKAGVSSSRIQLIPNGIDTAYFSPPNITEKRHARARLGLGESDLIVLYLGRLVSLKRVDLLLEAWHRLDTDEHCNLLIVGGGPERQALESLASDLALCNVRFEGPTDDVLSYLQAADVFVLPSQYEGMSVALLEAMAVGLTVVVTASPGNQAIIRHGENGLITPIDDLGALIAQLNSALQSPALRYQLSQNARRSLLATHSAQAVAQMYQTLYKDAMAGSG